MAEDNKPGILIVDDETEIGDLLGRDLKSEGYKTSVASTAEEGLEFVKKEKYFVAITDLKMPGAGGLAFIEKAKRIDPDLEVIVVTGFGSMDNSIASFRAGAFDFIQKPFTNVEIKLKVKRAIDKYHSKKMITLLNENVTKTYVELEKLKDSLEEKVQERTKELAESEKKYRTIIDDSFDPIITLDAAGNITGWNRGAEVTFGYAPDEMIGRNIERLFVLDPAKVMASLKERVKKEEGFTRNYITRCFRKNKEEIDVNITANVLNSVGLSLILRDITRERKIDQMKTDFVSNVSHELRTPLTSVKGAVELVLGGTEGPLTDSQKELLAVVKNNSVRLINLISELLDLSKIESGKVEMDIKLTGVVSIIRTTIEEAGPLAVNKKIKLQMSGGIDKLPEVFVDANKIKQVLFNLIGNALKFTPEGGSITVSAEERENELLISVKDTGIGISKEHFDMVFEKFMQVDSSSTRAAGGTGLGLAIAKSIVEAHKGKIWLESEQGKGTTFYFTLPKTRDDIRKAQNEADALERKMEGTGVFPSKAGFKIKKILVVDDDADLTLVIGEHLRRRGYEVFVSNSGMDAIKKAIDLQPDLITLDLLMPKMDGYFVTKLLKQNPKTKDIPIVIVSAVFEKEKCFRLGIADYITKPFDSALLADTITRTEKMIKGEALKKKVLVVDDDPDIVAVLTLSLTNRGYSVYNSYDGIQAIATAKKEKPDMIILDLMLPAVDGFSVIKALKNDPETAPIPIIVITGRTIEDREKAIQLGAKEYLIKPFTMRILFEELDKILAKEVK